MKLFWFSTILVITTNVVYHVSQKSIPENANPLNSVIVSFAVALVASIIIYPLFPSEGGFIAGFSKLNWASIVVGITIIGIEVGYLLIYRSGWNISLGPVFINALVIVILIPIGLLVFKEKLTFQNYIGIVFALIGIYLITK